MMTVLLRNQVPRAKARKIQKVQKVTLQGKIEIKIYYSFTNKYCINISFLSIINREVLSSKYLLIVAIIYGEFIKN